MLVTQAIQISPVSLDTGSKASFRLSTSGLNVIVLPAKDEDGSCATLFIYHKNRRNAVRHSFCRAVRLFDLYYGAVVIDDNVNISTLRFYKKSRKNLETIIASLNVANNLHVDAVSFNSLYASENNLKFNVTITLLNGTTVGEKALLYKCVNITNVVLVKDGKCRSRP